MQRNTLREIFAYNDWANGTMLRIAEGLNNADLDHPFELGLGSIRDTLSHIWAAERVWQDRWEGRSAKDAARLFEPSKRSVGEVAGLLREVGRARAALLERCDNAALAADVAFTNLRGESFRQPLGGLMLHVGNHGVHHRSQISNMFRHVGAELPKPGFDYIFFRLGQPEGGTERGSAPPLECAALAFYFRYGDWANARLRSAAGGLTPAQLDQHFEMGLGSLRATLLHIRFAEEWWWQNWTQGPGRPFPELDTTTSLDALAALSADTARRRDEFIRSLANDAALAGRTVATPRAGVMRNFSYGETMLQLCCHGTHHRAQASNMLRRLGVTPPGLDLAIMLRDVPS